MQFIVELLGQRCGIYKIKLNFLHAIKSKGANGYLQRRGTSPHSMHCTLSCDTIGIDHHYRCTPTGLACNCPKNVQDPSNMHHNGNPSSWHSYYAAIASANHHASRLRCSGGTAYSPSTRKLSTNHLDLCHSCERETIRNSPSKWGANDVSYQTNCSLNKKIHCFIDGNVDSIFCTKL